MADKIKSVRKTPYQIIEKGTDYVLMISDEEKYKPIRAASLLMKDFNRGDYLFELKTVGAGFVTYNYIKMNSSEIERYFLKEEPRDLTSKVGGASGFP